MPRGGSSAWLSCCFQELHGTSSQGGDGSSVNLSWCQATITTDDIPSIISTYLYDIKLQPTCSPSKDLLNQLKSRGSLPLYSLSKVFLGGPLSKYQPYLAFKIWRELAIPDHSTFCTNTIHYDYWLKWIHDPSFLYYCIFGLQLYVYYIRVDPTQLASK